MQHESDSQVRDRLLESAALLFRRYGYQAVGVDMLVDHSNVAKMTLYRQFESKDGLIQVFLESEDRRVHSWIGRATDACGSGREKITAFFRSLAQRIASESGAGCPFQLAAGEFADPDHPARRRAVAHKQTLRALLTEWTRSAGLQRAEGTANQLYILMEGAWAAARVSLPQRPTNDLVVAAMLIVEGGLFAQGVGGLYRDEMTNTD